MKRFASIISLLLTFVLLLSMPMAVLAAEPRSSSFFKNSSVYLYKTSSTQFQAWFSVSAVSGMDELGASTIKIQRSSDGENWTTMRTYTKDSYSQLIATNTGTHAACVTYTGTAGYYYRAYICLYAKNDSGTGSIHRYTSKIQL